MGMSSWGLCAGRRTAAGAGFRACGAGKGISIALATFGCFCGAFYVRCGALPLGARGSALRGGQGLSARPCNLRVSPS